MISSRVAATISIVLIAALTAQRAVGDRGKALELNERGERFYNLGRFQAAIELFEQAYQEQPAPEFLFNIAQAYRQLADCEHALFFYKRFLATNPKPELRSEVEGRVRELTDQCADKNQQGDRASNRVARSNAKTSSATASTTDADSSHNPRYDPNANAESNETRRATRPDAEPRPIRLRAEGGVALISLGAEEVPAQFSIRIQTGYEISLADAFAVEPQVSASLTPLPWPGHTEFLTTIAVGLGAHYEPFSDFRVGAEIGVGGLLLTQLAFGNPFTIGGASTTGPLWMPDTRASIDLEYQLTKSFGLAFVPVAVSFNPPKNGLREDIKLIRRIDILAGVFVRL